MDNWLIILGVAPFLIGMGGSVARRLVLGDDKIPLDQLPHAKKLYKATLPLHAMSVGAGLGFVGHRFGLPVPDAFGTEVGGEVLAYALSGGIAVIGYDSIVKTIRRILESYRVPAAMLPAEPQQPQVDPVDQPQDPTGT